MSLINGQNIDESDYINESEADATPTNDEGRVAKLENDGRFHPYFIRNGAQLTAGETLNGGSTPVPVYQSTSDNELYACDANDTTKLKFIGFVTSNGTNGNPARFQGSGVVSGFSSLAEGTAYYLQDAVGTIGTTPGTYEVLVGIAISETQLLIQKGRRRAVGAISLSDQGADENTTVQAITLGFRPSRIRLWSVCPGVAGAGDTYVRNELVWINGANVYERSEHQNVSSGRSNGAGAGSDVLVIGIGGTDHYHISITAVTGNGFSFSVLQKVTNPTSSSFVWEAEGDI